MFFTVAQDYMSVTVSLHALDASSISFPEGGDTALWLQVLKQNNIIFGINKSRLNNLVSGSLTLKSDEHRITIAEGELPVNEGLTVNYHFQHSQMPNLSEDAPADFRMLGFGVDVYQGQLIAEQHMIGPGVMGKTVYGETIPFVNTNKNPPLQFNTNVVVEKSGSSSRFFSKIDGVLINDQQSILQVEPELIVKSDVDFRIGNLSTKRSIIIEKDLKQGFAIRSGKDITIRGLVERNTIIEADGSITLEKGVADGTTLKAGGSINLKFAQGARIDTKEDLHVENYLYDCRVRAGNKIYGENTTLREGRGTIIGGTLNAIQGMEFNSIGSPNSLTTLLVGFDQEYRLNRNNLNNNKKEAEQEMARLLRRLDLDIFAPEVMQRLAKLPLEAQKKNKKILVNILQLRSQGKQIDQQVEGLESHNRGINQLATIKILQALYPDVDITIDTSELRAQHMYGPSTFYAKEGSVVVEDPA